MDAGTWALTGAVALLALGVVALAVLVLRLARVVAELRTSPSPASGDRAPERVVVEHTRPAEPEFVITTVGRAESEPQVVPDRVVLSATLGEPLVKAMAFGHGLRRALSAEQRNRIGFEVRREIKRSRKERRREMRAAWRAHRDAQRQTPKQTPRAERDAA